MSGRTTWERPAFDFEEDGAARRLVRAYRAYVERRELARDLGSDHLPALIADVREAACLVCPWWPRGDPLRDADASPPLELWLARRGFSRGAVARAARVAARRARRETDATRHLARTDAERARADRAALREARKRRAPLDLDLPERKVVLSETGKVTSVRFAERLDAHRLIEECMVLANVAAAETLVAKKMPLLFRVHEEPAPEKLDALREVAQAAGLTLAKGQVLRTAHLNALLHAAQGTDHAEIINMSTLRAMTQAYYAPQNFGHFGLALRAYAHFTSPIRRYADLVVHRALIAAHGWGRDGLSAEEIERLEQTAQHISETERRSMMAERDTNDRYLAAFLSERLGEDFTGRISGIARFGVFVKLDETGADGLIPMRALGHEYFHFDRDSGTLMGAETGRIIALGQRVTVRLAEAAPVSGGLAFDLVELEGVHVPRGPARARGKPPRRKLGAARAKAAKLRRKAARKRV